MVNRVGVLALQGNFEAHHQRLVELGEQPLLVKKASELDAISAIVLPGGESTTMLKLIDDVFFAKLQQLIRHGLPVLATCAGVILLAKGVTNPAQRSLAVLDVDVERNSYGRQVDSFIDAALPWTDAGRIWATSALASFPDEAAVLEAVFIRAPRITRTGKMVEILAANSDGDPLLIREGAIVAATFHPEQSLHARSVHLAFLHSLRKNDNC